MTTGKWIRKIRVEQEITQQELADRAGVSFSFVSQVEGGKQTVRLDALNKLLAVFGYTMAPKLIAESAPIQSEAIVRPQSPRPKNDWSFFD